MRVSCAVRVARVRSAAAVLAAAAWFGLASPARADIILFTADAQDLTFFNPGGAPANSNGGHLPAISAGVTLTPNTAELDGVETGPLGGITYGPGGFGGNAGGTTGFVGISYTLTVTSLYRLIFEVADVLDKGNQSALAADNVRINGILLDGFESGIPPGYTALGTAGTSIAVTNLAPTEGISFAYLDTTGLAPATFDTVDGTTGSRLISHDFLGNAGDELTLDAAFLTNDGDQFHDYGVVALVAVPELGGLTLCGVEIGLVLLFARLWAKSPARPG